MRNIEFRAFDGNTKSWVYVVMVHGQMQVNYSYANLNPEEDKIGEWLQYTGLKDKNNKKIYEGDILEHNSGNVQELKYVILEGSGYSGFQHLNVKSQIKIIGNIYENPELLK